MNVNDGLELFLLYTGWNAPLTVARSGEPPKIARRAALSCPLLCYQASVTRNTEKLYSLRQIKVQLYRCPVICAFLILEAGKSFGADKVPVWTMYSTFISCFVPYRKSRRGTLDKGRDPPPPPVQIRQNHDLQLTTVFHNMRTCMHASHAHHRFPSACPVDDIDIR